MIDTHAHLYGSDYAADLPQVMARAREAGVTRVYLPAVDAATCREALDVARQYAGYAYPMFGLHPEEVRADYLEQLSEIKHLIDDSLGADGMRPVAIGEVGLDYYWSREFADYQLDALRIKVEWSIETRLPLMIHCRKAQNELVALLSDYKSRLPGGVFHCFTGNCQEARQLLQFDNFVLGIGGVLTFRKSHLPDVLPAVCPLDRIVLETDSPYMAPVPMRGKRNESAYVSHVLVRIAQAYGVTVDEADRITTQTAMRILTPSSPQPSPSRERGL